MKEVIHTENLTKIYGKERVVDNVNFSVKEGEIFGFLGLNGAGKTTTIRMLLGMIVPTNGGVFLQGQKVQPKSIDIWAGVGNIVEKPYSYPELTVEENLEIIGKLRGIKDKQRILWVMKKLNLENYRSMKTKNLSQGNAQRLGIAKAIIHGPKILILDEPTNGLDPAGVVEVRQLLLELAQNFGVTVFLSSHKLEEISKIATNIAIIHDGKLIKKIDTKQLERQLKKTLLLDGHNKKEMKKVLSQSGYEIKHLEADSTERTLYLQLQSKEAINNPEKIVTLLVKNGYPPNFLKVEKEDLETYFLRTIEEMGD
ncbi:MAG: ABC transporter ATP-binding protein [Tetragenococcus sp.]|nr:ABC transporter ATP-binding protein [Tetragenococcus sp.]